MYGPWQKIRLVDPVSPRPNAFRKQKQDEGKSKRKKTTVLVVDDEHLIADTMTEILKRSGFHALCAYDGLSGLEMALEITPDVVLTDVVMPNMNGVQLAIAIRKALPSVEIILLSGQAIINDLVERGRNQGYSFELLAKPIHPEKLLRRLHEI
jgi:DNA-binding response OmpR family regulator